MDSKDDKSAAKDQKAKEKQEALEKETEENFANKKKNASGK